MNAELYRRFSGGGLYNEKITLDDFLHGLQRFGFNLDADETIRGIEDSLGYDRDSEITLYPAPDA